MTYEYLKNLYKTDENGNVIPMTYDQLEKAIDASKDIKLANLADGGYVSAEKFKAKETELAGVQKQLTDANTTIQGMKTKGADVDEKIKEWETKYAADTKALQDQMAAQQREYAENLFLSGYKFTSKAARAGVLSELKAQDFKIDDKGQLTGAADWIKSLSENEDYKAAFVTEQKQENDNGNQQGSGPRFAAGTDNGGGNGGGSNNLFSFGFQHLREPKK